MNRSILRSFTARVNAIGASIELVFCKLARIQFEAPWTIGRSGC